MSEIDPRFKRWAAERGLPEGYEDWRLARDAWEARGEHDKAERDAQGPENPVRDAALKELGSMIHPALPPEQKWTPQIGDWVKTPSSSFVVKGLGTSEHGDYAVDCHGTEYLLKHLEPASRPVEQPNTSGTSCTRIDQEMLEGYEQIAKHGYPSESSPPVKLATGSYPVIHPADWMKPAPVSFEERIERLEKIHNLASHAEK